MMVTLNTTLMQNLTQGSTAHGYRISLYIPSLGRGKSYISFTSAAQRLEMHAIASILGWLDEPKSYRSD
jgi:hypothetical protein